MSLDDAADIMRTEFQRRGIEASDEYFQRRGQMFHRGLGWPFLHPFKARREGYRFGLRARD